jgi:hypothetical protein
MTFARGSGMSAVRSTFWGVVIVLALLVIAVFAYGSCHGQP